MKTNELEKLLGTTKDTLRYYEKEELQLRHHVMIMVIVIIVMKIFE